MLFNSEYCEIIFSILCKIWGVSYFSPSIKFKKIFSFLFFVLSFITFGAVTSMTVYFMNDEELEVFQDDIEGLVCSVLFVVNGSIILISAFLCEKYEYKIHEKITETRTITKKLERNAKMYINEGDRSSTFKKCLKLFISYTLVISRVMFTNLSIWFDDDLDILNVVNHALMIIILFCYHYEKTVRKLGRRFEALNTLVDYKFENGDMNFKNRKKLDEFFWDIGKCYDNLHESSQMINKRFGSSIFMSIFSSLATLTYTVFYFFIELEKSQSQNWNLIGGKVFNNLARFQIESFSVIFRMCLVTHRICNEFHNCLCFMSNLS